MESYTTTRKLILNLAPSHNMKLWRVIFAGVLATLAFNVVMTLFRHLAFGLVLGLSLRGMKK